MDPNSSKKLAKNPPAKSPLSINPNAKPNNPRASPSMISPRVDRIRKTSMEGVISEELNFEKYFSSQQQFESKLSLEVTAAKPNLLATQKSEISQNSESFSSSTSRCNSPTVISMPPSPLATGKAAKDFSHRMSPFPENIRHLSSNSNSFDGLNNPFTGQSSSENLENTVMSNHDNTTPLHLPLNDHQIVPNIRDPNLYSPNRLARMSPSSLLINRDSHGSSANI